jgi:hypothetical protein
MELVIYRPGLLVMSVLGPLSDQLGRKPIIIGSAHPQIKEYKHILIRTSNHCDIPTVVIVIIRYSQ